MKVESALALTPAAIISEANVWRPAWGEAGRRLAASFPDSRFVELADSRTLSPIDQPRELGEAIAVAAT